MGSIKQSQIAELNAIVDRWQGTDFSQVDGSLKSIHRELFPSLYELTQTYIDAFRLPIDESAKLGETQSKEIADMLWSSFFIGVNFSIEKRDHLNTDEAFERLKGYQTIILSQALIQVYKQIKALEKNRIMKSKNAGNLTQIFANLFSEATKSSRKNRNFLRKRKCPYLVVVVAKLFLTKNKRKQVNDK